jgi:8-oxo-dGTP pyrophosphatase MutT (NUDIX family)
MNETDPKIPNPWRLIQDEAVFDCPYFTTRSDRVEDGLGQPRHYYNVRMKNFGLAVVPIDEEGHTILIGQQRYLLERFTWEVIRGGGRVNRAPVESAQDELSEETGYRANNWLQLFKASASPGVTDEFAIGFVAWGLRAGQPHPDASEDLVRLRVPFAKAVAMVFSGEIADLASSSLLLGIQLKFDRGELPADLAECLRKAQ